MGSPNRRRYVLRGAGGALVAGGVAVAVVLAFGTGSPAALPTKAQYLARVAAICRVYGPKLDRIPPADIAEPGNVIEAIRQALPIVTAEMRAVRALRAPAELRASLARWFELHDRGIAKLEEALRAARRQDLRALSIAYVQFTLQGPEARQLGAAIGIPHPPC